MRRPYRQEDQTDHPPAARRERLAGGSPARDRILLLEDRWRGRQGVVLGPAQPRDPGQRRARAQRH